ncbi:choice-of-anchor J domain-containing protein [Flavobacterium litorale]|uniref:Choice-of-anchor J domain-containing protein n=1 Tax=Flavobacterium litorale TaxID=2856519 RepID=A0ABX8V8Z0_9FLAO|nr:choice-of-anchor J domain-containing protein [Flavobacterium litorale]QYJ68987.1 choice-of-anchor J domain-containing protein [Flavobacterium litorale]
MKRITFLFFMSLVSLCGFAQMPLQGFDDTGVFPPTDWEVHDNGIGPLWSWGQALGAGPQPAYEGLHAAYINRENVAVGLPEDWLVTEQFNVPTNPQLRFWSRLTIGGDDGTLYRIYITDDPGVAFDPLNYDQIQEWTELQINPAQTVYTEQVVDIPAIYVGQDVRLAFVMIGDNGDRWLVDSASVVSQCLDPENLSAAPGIDNADLSWDNPSGATEWEIEVLAAAAIPNGVGITYNGTLPYEATTTDDGVTALTENTDYKYYVRALCDDGGTSEWVGPFLFSTVALGATCEAAIEITALPYTTTDNTGDYDDDYSGSPGAAGCGTTSGYLNGDDVVYEYTATTDGTISIDMTDNGAWSGMFIYDDCADIGTECIGGGPGGGAGNDVSVPALAVTAGQTYYIVISTFAAPQTTPYTLTIQQVFCDPPVGLPATNADEDSVDLSWTNPSGATSWEIVVQNPGDGIPAGAGTTVATNTEYNVDSLTEATNYEYYVRADCNDGNFSAWAGPYPFSTTQVAATMDYSQDFEGVNSGFSLSNGTATNQWAIGSAIANGGTQSLYISNDNGVSNEYTNNSTSVVHAYRDIQMPAVVDQALVSFDWNVDGENCCDYVRVWVVPASFTPTTGTLINAGAAGANAIQIGGNFNDSNGWETQNNVVDLSAYANQVMRLVFEWRNDGSVGQAPAAIDNIDVSLITCPSPSDLAIADLQEEEVTFTWTAPTSVTPTFDYYFATDTTAPDDATPPTGNVAVSTVNIGLLTPSTQYSFWVRSNCGVGDTSFWVGPLTFTTPQIPATIDYEEDFEGTIEWTLSNGTQTNQWVIDEAISSSPTHSLYISNDNGVSSAYTNNSSSVVHAYRDIAIPTGAADADLSFDYNVDGENCCDYVRVWVVPITFIPTPGALINGGAAGDDAFQVGGNFNNTADWQTENTVINVAAYADGVMRLVFEWRNDGSVGQAPAGIDNVNVSIITCPQPLDLAVSDIGETGATIAWTNQGTAAEWEVYIVSAGDPAPTDATVGITTTDNPYVATGLDDSTEYDVYVRAICDPTDSSNWTGPANFQTQCGSFGVPFFEGFNTDSTTQLCWTVLNDNGDFDAWNMDYNPNPFEGDQSAAITTDFNNGNNDDWLISPTIDLDSGNKRLKFHQRVQSSFEPNDFQVLLSVEGADIADFTAPTAVTLIPLAEYDNTEYIEYEVFLEDAGGTSITGEVNIAWHIPDGGLDGWRLYIDNVIIEDIPSCPQPTDLAVSSVGDTTVTLEWTEVGPATAWEVYVIPTGGDAPIDTTTEGVVAADSNPFVYDIDLEAGIVYDFYVKAVCGPDDESFWSGPFTFNTALCPLEDQCNYEFVMSDTGGNTWNGNTMTVSQGGIDIATLTGPTNADGTDPITQIVPLCAGIPFELYWNDAGFSDQQVAISIINPFDSETVFDKPAGEGSDNTLLYTGIPFCSEITCPQPTDLVAEGYNYIDSILLGWTPGGTETEWEVIVQDAGGTYPGNDPDPTTIVTVTGDPEYIAGDLVPDDFYEYYVRAICGPDDASFWTGPFEFSIFAPPGCAAVEVLDELTLEIIVPNSEVSLCPEDEACYELSANYYQLKGTDSYAVESIDYAPPYPFLGGTELNVNTDDIWSPVVDLPFEFCFYGETYNEAKVGSNGVVQFGENMTDGGFCPWSFDESVPDANFPILNAIYGVYQDVNPNVAGSEVNINYQVLGSYPCRALVVNYFDVPQFSCGLNVGTQTTQIVIYEISNIIDVYVESRTPCTGWQNGAGVIGIQNADGTEGITPPDRNTGDWTATEEAWRFTPDGEDLNVVFEWLQDDVFVTNDTDLQVCPTESTNLKARVTYTTCSGEELIRENNFTINVATPIIIINDPQDLSACSTGEAVEFDLTDSLEGIMDDTTGFTFTFYATEEAADLGLDDNLPDLYTTDTNETIWIRVMEDGFDCYITASFELTLSNIPPEFTASDDISICEGTDTTLEVFAGNFDPNSPDVSYTWTLDGNDTGLTTQAITVTAGGTYEVTVNNAGCVGSEEIVVTVVPVPVADVLADATVCDSYELPVLTIGNYFTQTGGQGAALSAGDMITSTQEIYIYAVSADNADCTNESSFTITVNDSPEVSTPGNQTACDSYTLPALTLGNYYTQTGGAGTMLNPGDAITSTQTLYIYAETGTTPNCTGEESFEVTIIDSPEAQVLADVTSCDSYVLEALDADNNYFTAPGGTGTALSAGDVITSTQTLYIYAQTGTTPNCTDESTFVVNIIDSPAFSLGGPYNTCVANNVTINVEPANFNTAEATYAWTLNGTPLADTGASVVPTNFGTYEVTVTVGICTSVQSIAVTQDTNAIAVMFEEGCEGGDYMITIMDVDGSFNPDNATYVWSGEGGFTATTQTVTVPGAGNYTVTVTTQDGCIGGTTVNVLDTSCSIPRGISPNNDDRNDKFDLTSLDVRQISIFNRYGKEVFSYGAYTDQWHGQTNDGDELPTGTYFYSIERSNGESKTGWVYINREE